MFIRQLYVLSFVLSFCHVAKSDTGSISFSGTVSATCALNVTNGSGLLTPSASLSNLSSKNAGGVPGTVTMTSTGGVSLSVDNVTSPIHPAADTSLTTWTPSYRMSGAQTVPETTGTTMITAAGTGAIVVELTGTKGGGGAFQIGTYGATVTVRCEP